MPTENSYLSDIEEILLHRHDNGGDYWATPDKRLLKGAPFTTIESPLYLLELGVSADDPIMKETANLIFSTWKEDGRFKIFPTGSIYPCQTAESARTLCYIQDYLNINNNGGIAVLDSAAEYIPIDNKPYAIDEKQMQAVKTKIYDYLGVSEAIVNSSYDENQWAAFYESVIEPLALQLSLEFTRKLFNDRERAFGNSILFESGRLQFTSNATKVNLIREIMPMGLLTVNQALEILNLPSVSGGDRRIQSLNYVDADKAEEYQLAKAKAPAALNGDTGAGADGKNGENGGTQA